MSDYPTIKTGLGKLTPDMWDRLMRMLRWFEEGNVQEHDLKKLDLRIQTLETTRGWFFAKLVRAHVMDESLQNPNVYEYAWVEVNPISCDEVVCRDCSADCLASRHGVLWSPTECCDYFGATAYSKLQGHWEWQENPLNSSWGDTLIENNDGEFADTEDNGGTGGGNIGDDQNAVSVYNPNRWPALEDFTGGAENLIKPYTKPAMNILESFNTYYDAAGVHIGGGIGDFMMQAIGGGDTVRTVSMGYDGSESIGIPECWDIENEAEPPCTQFEFPLLTTPIVMMYHMREPNGSLRHIFQVVNSFDGTCVSC